MKDVSTRSICSGVICAGVLLGAALVGGCTSESAVVQQSRPSVTYHFSSEEGLVEATNKAEAYCSDYHAYPRQVGSDLDGDEVTFVCDRDTAYEPEPDWTDRHVDFTFSSDNDLIEATERAESYCARYHAEPSDMHFHRNPDGTRTATFTCEG